MRTLKVLRLTTYPIYRNEKHTIPDAGTSEHILVLKTAADRLFQTLGPACPKLLAVVHDDVGGTSKIITGNPSRRTHSCVPSKSILPEDPCTLVRLSKYT